jgi:ribosomal protein S18 acetylase RimI-like enzyme
MITVSILEKATPEAFKQICALLPQLRNNPAHTYTEPSYEELVDLVADQTAALVVVKDDDRIIGMATLFVLARVGEIAGYVEDVVVDSAYRGQGLATKLMTTLIETAKARGVKDLDLTSRPAREAANHLYQKLGFEVRPTNPYRLKIK